MGLFIKNVTEVRQDTGAHVAIVHHGTKNSNGSNPRGHSSLTGADDALIEVMKLEDGSRVATVVHAKDDADGMRWGFDLAMVELGTDPDGDPIKTLIVNEQADTPAAPEKRARLTNNEQIGLKALHATMKASAIVATVGEDHAERSVATEADWRAWYYHEGKPGEPEGTKRKAFGRIVDGLLAKNLIGSFDGFVWPTERES